MLSALRRRFLIMGVYADMYSVKEFPKTLTSLEINNPDDTQILNDHKIISRFNNHPVFQYIHSKNEEFQNKINNK